MAELKFEEMNPSRFVRSKTWKVVSILTSVELGEITKREDWGQYVFYPRANSLYNPEYLREIAEFLEVENLTRSQLEKMRKG